MYPIRKSVYLFVAISFIVTSFARSDSSPFGLAHKKLQDLRLINYSDYRALEQIFNNATPVQISELPFYKSEDGSPSVLFYGSDITSSSYTTDIDLYSEEFLSNLENEHIGLNESFFLLPVTSKRGQPLVYRVYCDSSPADNGRFFFSTCKTRIGALNAVDFNSNNELMLSDLDHYFMNVNPRAVRSKNENSVSFQQFLSNFILDFSTYSYTLLPSRTSILENDESTLEFRAVGDTHSSFVSKQSSKDAQGKQVTGYRIYWARIKPNA